MLSIRNRGIVFVISFRYPEPAVAVEPDLDATSRALLKYVVPFGFSGRQCCTAETNGKVQHLVNWFTWCSCSEEAKATEGKSTACAQVKPQRVAPRKRKPPRKRALPVPRLNHKEVSDPADVPHAASDVVEMLSESSEAVSQETSTDNMEGNSPGD
ncbi:hypothetical protein HPB51_011510 [Rhipicephalus microplus]|uniref:Uncharacterized protein n=1 Tax=Rhipicephalus microplus TaxID=6941 RepID=A0A9J6D9P9_RHIMP|nr:hypothetical protein HPB51_011510 [Rhipicephalus microplus]